MSSKAKDKSIFTITSAHKSNFEFETNLNLGFNVRERGRQRIALPIVFGPEDIRPVPGSSDAVNSHIERFRREENTENTN